MVGKKKQRTNSFFFYYYRNPKIKPTTKTMNDVSPTSDNHE